MVLVLAACGGDSDPVGDSAEATIAPTEAPTTVPGNEPNLGDECLALADFALDVSEIMTGQFSGIDQVFATVSANLPGELGNEVDVIKTALLQFESATEESGVDLSDPEAVATLTPEQLGGFDEAYSAMQLATNDAFEAIAAWGVAACPELVPDG